MKMRLIDIEDVALLKTVTDGGLSAKALWRRINSQPTVDAVPVKHGKWRFVNCITGLRCQCSECLHWVDAGADKNYCPNCGARMDAERKEE